MSERDFWARQDKAIRVLDAVESTEGDGIRALVTNVLKAIGAKGLYCGMYSCECGCGVDYLMPCDQPNLSCCVPAYHVSEDEDGQEWYWASEKDYEEWMANESTERA